MATDMMLIGALTVAIPPVPASAQVLGGGTLGWSACSWTWRAREFGDPTVHIYREPNESWPPANYSPTTFLGLPQNHSNRLQSFDARYGDAITRWNTAMAGAPHAMRFAQTTSATNAEVRLHYQIGGLGGTDNLLLGRADIRLRGTPPPATTTEFDFIRCPVHVDELAAAPQTFHIAAADVIIVHRDDWFTMGDEMRSTWERCGPFTVNPDPAFLLDPANLFLCSKLHDFGAVIIHELGHVLGIHHPETVEITNSGAANAAACMPPWAHPREQATMCRTTYFHRSERRLLDQWDIDSIVRHHQVHA